jgi:hypothetical protein
MVEVGFLLLKILIGVATTAIGRGIVLALGLDQKVAALIKKGRDWRGTPALGWIMSGCLGLLVLMAWEAFDIDAKLKNFFTKPPAFSAQIRSATIHTANSPYGMFMVVYPSPRGITASPACLLFYVQVTNLQNVTSKINSYSTFVSDDLGSSWTPLRSIDIVHAGLFVISNQPIAPHEVRGDLGVPKGTYKLATPMQPQDMKNAVPVELRPLLNVQLQKQIDSHSSIEGWIALDRLSEKFGSELPKLSYKFVFLDSAGMSDTVIVRPPMPSPGRRD